MSHLATDSADDQAPAGSPAEQRALDRPWRFWATGIVVAAVALAALLGFLIIPAGQRENAGLSLYGAICRAVGISPGSPAERQPQNRAVALPVRVVSWDPEIMKTLASRDNPRGAALAAQVCAACHGEKGLSQSNIPSLAGQSSYALYK